MTPDARQKRVTRVKSLYPDAFKRVRDACVFASPHVDLDHHAAMIVMAGKGKS